jgi:putative nucleotidyltransferase with HDIG domain
MPPKTRAPLRRPTQIYITVVVFFGLLAVVASAIDVLQLLHDAPGSPNDPRGNWAIFAGLTLLSGLASVRLPSINASISISETFVFAGTLLFGRSVGTILVLLDVIVLCGKLATKRRIRWEQVLFNLATPPLSIWVAATATGIIRPFPEGTLIDWHFVVVLAFFTAIFFLLNSWIVTFAVSLEQKVAPIATWWAHFKELSVNFAAGASIATFLFSVGTKNLLWFFLIIVPLLGIIYLTFARFTKRIEDERQKNLELNRVFLSTIEALALAIDAKDQVTHGHIRRVQRFTMALADALGVKDEKQLDALKAAALLHDTGKLAVPEYILNKPGPLTSSEFERMKVHAAVGADILKSIEFPYPVEPIVRHHHENWDGSGYPDGIKGQAIPLGARMLSVVDCYDALTSDRPYRPRMTRQQAEQVLRDRRSSMYDPWIVDEFLRILDKLEVEERGAAVDFPWSTPILTPQQLEVITATSAEEREFNELRRELPKATSISAAADVLFRHLRRVVPAASFALYVPRQDANELNVLVCSGVGTSTLKEVKIPIGERISGWAFAHKQVVLNSEATLELGPVARTFSTPLKYALAVPILDGPSVAVITLYGPELFDKDHRRLLESAATLFIASLSTPETEGQAESGTDGPKRGASVLARPKVH